MTKAKRKNMVNAYELISGLKVALKYISLDQTRLSLTGILLEVGKGARGKKEGLNIVATNGSRLHVKTIEMENTGKWPESNVIIEAKDAKALIRMVGRIKETEKPMKKAIISKIEKDIVEIIVDGNACVLKCITNAHFPDWRQIIPDINNPKSTVWVDTKGLIAGLNIIKTATIDPWQQHMDVTYEESKSDGEHSTPDGKLVLKVCHKNTDMGGTLCNADIDVSVRLDVRKVENEHTDFRINPGYLLDAVESYSGYSVPIQTCSFLSKEEVVEEKKTLRPVIIVGGGLSILMPTKR